MPIRTLSQFPTQFDELVAVVVGGREVKSRLLPNKKAAENLRYTFYNYRQVLRKAANRETHLEEKLVLEQKLLLADSVVATVIPADAGYFVRWRSKDQTETAMLLQEAINNATA